MKIMQLMELLEDERNLAFEEAAVVAALADSPAHAAVAIRALIAKDSE